MENNKVDNTAKNKTINEESLNQILQLIGENEDGKNKYRYRIKKMKQYVMWKANGCEACNDLDGQIFKLGKEPKPPHPNCKCTLVLVGKNGK